MNGTTATYVQQVSPLCVRVDQNGQWLGTPVARGITGNAGATSYSKMCPVNSAISGFRGRAAQYVEPDRSRMPDADVQRQADGRRHFLGRGRSRHRHAVGPYRCGTSNPGTRSTAARAAGWTTSACSAARRRRHSLTRRPTLRIRAASRPSPDRRSIWPSAPRTPMAIRSPSAPLAFPPGSASMPATGRITGAPDHGRRLRRRRSVCPTARSARA